MVAAVRAALAAALLGACAYSPSFTECEVRCAEGACPSGMSCRSDGYCHPGAVAEPFGACTAVVDAAEADAAAADAAPVDAAGVDAAAADAAPVVPGMVYIPAGPFVMGSDSGEGSTDEEPEHVVTLSAYYIDVHEVTNADWQACVTGGGCSPPMSADSHMRTGYYTEPIYHDYPVIFVEWSQASAYCTWAGKRMPTEAEWEKAARGGCEIEAPSSCGPEDERTYPWGEAEPTCGQANGYLGGYCVSGGDTDAVGARSPAGDSPYGVQDMAGNVWEWVADWYDPTYYASSPDTDPHGPVSGTARVGRGGSWVSDAPTLRIACRFGCDQTLQYDTVGVRCARSP